jgi:hypothetical protein
VCTGKQASLHTITHATRLCPPASGGFTLWWGGAGGGSSSASGCERVIIARAVREREEEGGEKRGGREGGREGGRGLSKRETDDGQTEQTVRAAAGFFVFG